MPQGSLPQQVGGAGFCCLLCRLVLGLPFSVLVVVVALVVSLPPMKVEAHLGCLPCRLVLGQPFSAPLWWHDSAHWELVVALVGCVFVPNEGGSSSWLHHSLANSKSRGLTRLPLLDLECLGCLVLDLECVGCLMDGMVGCCSVLAFLNSHRESRLVVVFSV